MAKANVQPKTGAFSALAATPRGSARPSLPPRASAPTVSPRTVTGSFVYDGGFETEFTTPSWTQSSSGGRQLVTTIHPHTGSYSADLCQNTNGCSDVVYQTFTVPTKVISATLSFWFQVQTSDSTAPPSPCNDFMGAGVSDAGFVVTQSSAIKVCEDWGQVSGYTGYSINETAFLQAHQGQTAHVEGVGSTDAAGPSVYWLDDFALTITYATPPTQVTGVLAEPNNTAVTLKWQSPADNGGDPISGYQVSVFKNGSPAAGANFNSTTTTEVIRNLSNGASFTFQVQAINADGPGRVS